MPGTNLNNTPDSLGSELFSTQETVPDLNGTSAVRVTTYGDGQASVRADPKPRAPGRQCSRTVFNSRIS